MPGVYVIGSLAGYPLIKQAMNQGYDVVEFINGNDLKPADHPLLEYQFHGLPFERPVDEMVERFQTLIPMFRQMNAPGVPRADHRERRDRRVSGRRGVRRRCEAQDAAC